MNKYEIMFIVKATMESETVKASAETMKKVISDNGSNVIEFKELGEKKLAYPIKKEITGYYFLMQALLDETILRHLIIKLDEE